MRCTLTNLLISCPSNSRIIGLSTNIHSLDVPIESQMSHKESPHFPTPAATGHDGVAPNDGMDANLQYVGAHPGTETPIGFALANLKSTPRSAVPMGLRKSPQEDEVDGSVYRDPNYSTKAASSTIMTPVCLLPFFDDRFVPSPTLDEFLSPDPKNKVPSSLREDCFVPSSVCDESLYPDPKNKSPTRNAHIDADPIVAELSGLVSSHLLMRFFNYWHS